MGARIGLAPNLRRMSENLRTYYKSVFAFDSAMQRVPGSGWDKPSPCADWTASEVAGHVAWTLSNWASRINGGGGRPEQAEADVAGDDPLAAWSEARDQILEALDKRRILQAVTATPVGEMSIDRALGIFHLDPLLHAWDVAQAVGIDPGVAQDHADRSLMSFSKTNDGSGIPGMFDPKREAPAHADAMTRLAAYTGRSV